MIEIDTVVTKDLDGTVFVSSNVVIVVHDVDAFLILMLLLLMVMILMERLLLQIMMLLSSFCSYNCPCLVVWSGPCFCRMNGGEVV